MQVLDWLARVLAVPGCTIGSIRPVCRLRDYVCYSALRVCSTSTVFLTQPSWLYPDFIQCPANVSNPCRLPAVKALPTC